MAKLTTTQIKELFEGIIKPFGHPDPVGYLIRAFIESEWESEYYSPDGKVGFMPVEPGIAFELTGASDMSDLGTNVMATMTIDKINFARTKSIDGMISAFKYGADNEDNSEARSYIKEINDSRQEMINLLFPRKARVSDVINFFKSSNLKSTDKTIDFVKSILQY